MPAVKVGEPYYVVDGTKYTQSALSKKSLQEQTLIKLAAQEQAVPTAAAVHSKLYGGTAGSALKSSQYWGSYNKNVLDLTEKYKQARAAGDLARAKKLWESGMSNYSVDVHREMSIPSGTSVVYPADFWGPAKVEASPPGPSQEMAAKMFPPPRGIKLMAVDPGARVGPGPLSYREDVSVLPQPPPFSPAVPGGALVAGPVYDPSSVKYLKELEKGMTRSEQEALEYEMARAKGLTSEQLQARYEEIRSRITGATRETPISIELEQRERRFGVSAEAEKVPLFMAALAGSFAIGSKEGFIDPVIGTITDPVGTGKMLLAGGYEAATDPLGFLTGVSEFAMEKTGEYGPGYLPGFAAGMYLQGRVYGKAFQVGMSGVRTLTRLPFYIEGPWKAGKIHLEQKVLTRVRGKVPTPTKLDIPFKSGTQARSLYDVVSKRFKATTGGSVSTELLVGKKLPRHAFKFSKDLDLVFSSVDDFNDAYKYLLKHGARETGTGGVLIKHGKRWVHWDMHVEPGHGYTTIGGHRVLSYREQLFRKGPKTMLNPEEWGRAGLDIPGKHVRTFEEFKRARGPAQPELIFMKDAMDFPFLIDEMMGKPTDYSAFVKPSWLDDFSVQVTGVRAKQVRLVARTPKAAARIERAGRAARVSAEASQVVESVASVESAISSSMSVVMSSLSVLGGGSRPSRPAKVSREAPSRPSMREASVIPIKIVDFTSELSSMLPSELRSYAAPRAARRIPSRVPSRAPSRLRPSPALPIEDIVISISNMVRESSPGGGPPPRAPPLPGGYSYLDEVFGPPTVVGPPRKIGEEDKRRKGRRKADRKREYEYQPSLWGWLTGEEVEEEPSPLYWTGFSTRPTVKRKRRKR